MADADALVRRALRLAMRSQRGLTIGGEARDGDEAVRAVSEGWPDVVLADAHLPNHGGLIELRRILRAQPQALVVMQAAVVDHDAALLALRAGAIGYLEKDISPVALGRALRGVVRGGQAAVPRVLTLSLVDQLRWWSSDPEAHAAPRRFLTSSQWELLRLLCDRLSDEAIAVALDVSGDTVRRHTRRLLGKLEARSREEAVALGDQILSGAWMPAEWGVDDLDEVAFGPWTRAPGQNPAR